MKREDREDRGQRREKREKRIIIYIKFDIIGVQEAPAEAPGGPDLDPQHQQQDQQPIDIGVVEPQIYIYLASLYLLFINKQSKSITKIVILIEII